jgi:hypothetical protein
LTPAKATISAGLRAASRALSASGRPESATAAAIAAGHRRLGDGSGSERQADDRGN